MKLKLLLKSYNFPLELRMPCKLVYHRYSSLLLLELGNLGRNQLLFGPPSWQHRAELKQSRWQADDERHDSRQDAELIRTFRTRKGMAAWRNASRGRASRSGDIFVSSAGDSIAKANCNGDASSWNHHRLDAETWTASCWLPSYIFGWLFPQQLLFVTRWFGNHATFRVPVHQRIYSITLYPPSSARPTKIRFRIVVSGAICATWWDPSCFKMRPIDWEVGDPNRFSFDQYRGIDDRLWKPPTFPRLKT